MRRAALVVVGLILLAEVLEVVVMTTGLVLVSVAAPPEPDRQPSTADQVVFYLSACAAIVWAGLCAWGAVGALSAAVRRTPPRRRLLVLLAAGHTALAWYIAEQGELPLALAVLVIAALLGLLPLRAGTGQGAGPRHRRAG
ncbi:hypothetical protein ACFC1R_19105 [Kitasatospora sp. NPDC056138]|uniref:hypothetical protein n=1 Tax=Kitasatospora sp. NPDC056138 TaxID=3345724 RepID=UPI0035D61DC4